MDQSKVLYSKEVLLGNKEHVLIVGFGDIGERIARLEQEGGSSVVALCRGHQRIQRFTDPSIKHWAADLDRPMTKIEGTYNAIYYLAPPSPEGLRDQRIVRCLEALGTLPHKLIYLSTSAVYGDCKGAWIDENHPLCPGTERGKRRLFAEETSLEWGRQHAVPVVILRVPGIYGPGRLPLTRIREKLPVIDPKESPYTNRIHADDLAQAAYRARQKGASGHAYNISDGHPTTMTDYFWKIADRYGLERPPSIPLNEAKVRLNPGMLSFLEESKRLINQRMLDDLGVHLQYPTLDLGLDYASPSDPTVLQ